MCLGQGWGINGVRGPAGGRERLPGAPVGFPSPGQRETLLQRGSLCVDALITSPTSPPLSRPPLEEALLRTPSSTKRLPVGPQSRQSGSCSPQRPVDRAGGKRRFQTPKPGVAVGCGDEEEGSGETRREGARAGRAGASGRGVKCAISGCAVVPDSLPSARGCLMLEYARDSPSHRYTRAHTRTLTHAHAPLFADRAPVAPK